MIDHIKQHPIMTILVLGATLIGGILGPTLFPGFSLWKAIFSGAFFGANMGLLMIGSSIMNTATIPRINLWKSFSKTRSRASWKRLILNVRNSLIKSEKIKMDQ